ncbi:PGN_0703 family putative restriction endonuclease [Miniphocaeibacter massiliensis]|uniref:PGN_0703 family putative restriction endonuclease n=1 Tax=Miniphocaeibacter massiliensis TaxID=2041841 RepID=UPI000C1C7C85|nr:hypothetical protein [Miniphocaeibacter massiliensis]
MRYKEFDRRVKNHLSKYKKDILRIEESGYHNGKLEDYILPDSIEKNFIGNSYSIYKEKYDKNRTHLYSNHLCSSQVMNINFFIPLIEEIDLLNKIIKHILNLDDKLGKIKKYEFDYKPGLDEKKEIDLYLEYEDGKKVYIQTKYVESNFGEFLDNNKSKEWEEKYSELLSESLYLKDIKKDEFYKNYELNRNIGLVRSDNEYSVFIYPYENESLRNIVEDIDMKNIKGIDWNSIVYYVLKLVNDSELEDYYREFSRKYLNY